MKQQVDGSHGRNAVSDRQVMHYDTIKGHALRVSLAVTYLGGQAVLLHFIFVDLFWNVFVYLWKPFLQRMV